MASATKMVSSGPRAMALTWPNSSGVCCSVSDLGPMETTGVSCHRGGVPAFVTWTTPPMVSKAVARSLPPEGEFSLIAGCCQGRREEERNLGGGDTRRMRGRDHSWAR